MRIVGGQVADFAVLDRDEKQMGTLVAGEVVPMAVEEMGKDLGFDLAVGFRFVVVSVARIAGLGIGNGDGRAIRIDV